MKADSMILGKNEVYSTDCSKTGLNNNVIICGTSGCGKTMSVSEPHLLEAVHSSQIITVTKRRIVDKYRPVLEKRGFEVLDMNFIRPEDSTASYDPLQYLNSYTDIKFLARSIVNADPRRERSNDDPYWSDSAISLLSAEIAYVLMVKGQDNASFADVLRLHDRLHITGDREAITTTLDKSFDRIREVDANCFAVNCWETFHQLPLRTASCIYSQLNSAIDNIFSPELRTMIAKAKKIDFKQMATKKTVLFITTSPVNPALQSFVNMFYGQMFKSLFEFAEEQPNGKLPIPMHVLCDDFATGSRILNFPEYISIFREKQISVTLLIQSESQLAGMYGKDDATTIINNCDTYVYMGGTDIKTGTTISERLNIPLYDVLYMPIGQEYVFRRGQEPIKTWRYNILEDKRYQKITEEYEANIAEKKADIAERKKADETR